MGYRVIDKLDLRIPRHAQFTPSFGRLYPELRALEKGPFHPSKYYEVSGDLREYGQNVRLSLYCQMDTVGNHKVELIDVGKMSRREILNEIGSIFEVNPPALEVMRVDFAVDVPELPLRWFRETVRVERKRFRAAVTGEPFFSEMGNGDIQTLYFGKRPNLIRIYDKLAEYKHQYRMMIRNLEKGAEPPSFESVYGDSSPDSHLTRVERQIGGRIPTQVATLRQVLAPAEFRPFEKLKIINHEPMPERDSSWSFETYCTGMFLRSIAENDGMQALKAFISKQSKGNVSWAWKKYESFLPSSSLASGISETELQRRFEESLTRQMSGTANSGSKGVY
jgi:hypothetical protein